MTTNVSFVIVCSLTELIFVGVVNILCLVKILEWMIRYLGIIIIIDKDYQTDIKEVFSYDNLSKLEYGLILRNYVNL